MADKNRVKPASAVIWYEYMQRFSSAPPVGMHVFDEHYEMACVIPTGPATRPTDLLVDLLNPSVIDTLSAGRPLRYYDVLSICTSADAKFDVTQPVWVKSYMVVSREFCKKYGAGADMYGRSDEPDYVLIELKQPFASFREK